ncbi:unnamed protein product [Musa acuminata subsp. burmannicoides]
MELENSSVMTVSNSGSGEASVSSSGQQQPPAPPPPLPPPSIPGVKKKRNLPGNPDPEAEVIALSPKTLLATNRFVCEICNKGFQRDQNLQLHRRGHNLPWKLRQRTGKEARKRVYVCPESSCVHHDPSRALGDLTGIKKHFCRKHGEKKWKCDKCSKKYAVQSDWKAHSKVCGTREYRCDCGTLFSRRDSFITHRAFCDALAEENGKKGGAAPPTNSKPPSEDDGKAAAAAEATVAAAAEEAPAAVAAPSSPLQQAAPLEQQELENPTELLQYMPPPPASIAHASGAITSSGSSSSSSNTSLFASLFASSGTTAAAHSTATLSDLMGTMSHVDRTLMDPPLLCLATNGGPASLFSPQAQAHDRRPFAPPPPSPHMSATALLQKAAQMGAAATGSSFLKGFGLDTPTGQQESIQDSCLQWGRRHHHHQQLEPEPAPMLSAQLGLGLACEPDLMMGSSPLFGPKPATLDLLGLGMGPVAGSANVRIPALMTSISSGGVDIGSGTATGGWEGAERKAK